MKYYYKEFYWQPRFQHGFNNKYEHEDWEFTGRLEYGTHHVQKRNDEVGEKKVILRFEVRGIDMMDVPNPAYCKYFGDRRKTILGYKTWWLNSEELHYEVPRIKDTYVLYECENST